MERSSQVTVIFQISSEKINENKCALITVPISNSIIDILRDHQTEALKTQYVTIESFNRESKLIDKKEFDKALSEYEIDDFDTIKSERLFMQAFTLEDKSDDLPSANLTVPSHFTMNFGLNLIGLCNNQDCEAYNTKLVCKYGFLEWDAFLSEYISCPKCEKRQLKPFKIVLFQCRYKIEGTYIDKIDDDEDEKELDDEWNTAEKSPHVIDFEIENDNFRRTAFKISLEELP